MQRNDAPWREQLDIITAWGEASAANQTPPPMDEQLWAVSRVRGQRRPHRQGRARPCRHAVRGAVLSTATLGRPLGPLPHTQSVQ